MTKAHYTIENVEKIARILAAKLPSRTSKEVQGLADFILWSHSSFSAAKTAAENS